MRNSDALDVLGRCQDSRNCHNLQGYLLDMKTLDELGYEDVFYPLRHHHAEGLAIQLAYGQSGVMTLVWGGGDLIFPAEEEHKVMSRAINPFARFEELQRGVCELDVVVLDDHRPEATRDRP